MKLRPESITARVALSTSLRRWAWVARGNGMANTVTPEGWTLFKERIHESEIVLEGSADMKNMCPEWYVEMMAVGLANHWPDQRMHDLLDRGIQFEPAYQYLYTQYAQYLLPKWYGKLGDTTTFAKTSADRLGAEAGDILYFQIAATIVRQGNGKLQFRPEDFDWPRIQQGYHAAVAAYGPARPELNQLAYMAYRFQDKAVAQQQFALIGSDWGSAVWRTRQFFDRARDWSRGDTAWP